MKKSEVNLYEVYDNWRNNSGKFECYAKTTPFSSLKVYPDFNINRQLSVKKQSQELYKKIEGLIKTASSDKIYVFDLEAEISVDIALMLNNRAEIKPILSLNHIFHEFGVVGSRELAERLIVNGLNLKNIKPVTFSFMLDYNRYIDEKKIDKANMFNNQYEVTEEEFPDEDSLKQLNIKEVIYISDGVIKEDIACYFDFLSQNGFQTQIIEIG